MQILEIAKTYKETPEFHVDVASVVPTFPTELAAAAGDADGPPAAKRARGEDGAANPRGVTSFPANGHVTKLMGIMKPHLNDFIECMEDLKIFMQLRVPPVESNANWKVGILEECLGEVSRSEDSAFSVLEAMTKYHVTRAKLVQKCLKYPAIGDYQASVSELDEKEFLNLRMCMMDLRNMYFTLRDLLVKNEDKIRQPVSMNQTHGY